MGGNRVSIRDKNWLIRVISHSRQAAGQRSSCNDSIYMMAIIILPCTALTAAVNWITSSSTVAHSWKMDVQHGYKSRLSSACWLTQKKSFRLWLDEVQGSAPFTRCFPCWGVATWTRHIFVRKKYRSGALKSRSKLRAAIGLRASLEIFYYVKI